MKKLFNSTILKEAFIWFMLYAFIGWSYEVFLEVIVYKWGFTNRGVLFGPYCPVYGFGALFFILFLQRLIKNKSVDRKFIMAPIIFLGSMLIATLLELFASYLCEFFIGSWPWQTYVDYAYNFEGRIALSPSIRFGIGGLLFLYLLQPLFEKLTHALGKKCLNIVSLFLLFTLILDLIYSFILK